MRTPSLVPAPGGPALRVSLPTRPPMCTIRWYATPRAAGTRRRGRPKRSVPSSSPTRRVFTGS